METFLINKIDEIVFSTVDVTDSLLESGVLDSITAVEFATEVEDEYNIDIPFDEIVEDNFETLSLLINYIEKKLREKNA